MYDVKITEDPAELLETEPAPPKEDENSFGSFFIGNIQTEEETEDLNKEILELNKKIDNLQYSYHNVEEQKEKYYSHILKIENDNLELIEENKNIKKQLKKALLQIGLPEHEQNPREMRSKQRLMKTRSAVPSPANLKNITSASVCSSPQFGANLTPDSTPRVSNFLFSNKKTIASHKPIIATKSELSLHQLALQAMQGGKVNITNRDNASSTDAPAPTRTKEIKKLNKLNKRFLNLNEDFLDVRGELQNLDEKLEGIENTEKKMEGHVIESKTMLRKTNEGVEIVMEQMNDIYDKINAIQINADVIAHFKFQFNNILSAIANINSERESFGLGDERIKKSETDSFEKGRDFLFPKKDEDPFNLLEQVKDKISVADDSVTQIFPDFSPRRRSITKSEKKQQQVFHNFASDRLPFQTELTSSTVPTHNRLISDLEFTSQFTQQQQMTQNLETLSDFALKMKEMVSKLTERQEKMEKNLSSVEIMIGDLKNLGETAALTEGLEHIKVKGRLDEMKILSESFCLPKSHELILTNQKKRINFHHKPPHGYYAHHAPGTGVPPSNTATGIHGLNPPSAAAAASAAKRQFSPFFKHLNSSYIK